MSNVALKRMYVESLFTMVFGTDIHKCKNIRRQMQSVVYLLQELGVNLDYLFTWRSKFLAPFSSELAADMHNAFYVPVDKQIVFADEVLRVVAKVKRIFVEKCPADVDLVYWCMFIVSLYHTAKYRLDRVDKINAVYRYAETLTAAGVEFDNNVLHKAYTTLETELNNI